MIEIHCKYDLLVSPDSLSPYPDNTNEHPPAQISLLGDIIQYQGWRHPVIVSTLSNKIIAGHGRWMVALDRKWDNVPVVFQSFENKEQEYAFLESDNHIAEMSEHNLGLMWTNLKNLPEFDLKMLGIPDLSINSLIEKINKGDENSDWFKSEEYPEFIQKEDLYKILFQFHDENSRKEYVEKNNIKITKNHNGVWLINI